MKQLPSGKFAGFPIKGFYVQNYCVTPWSTQSFILSRSIRWVLRTPGDLVVKSGLSFHNGSVALSQLSLTLKKGP